MGVYYVTTLEKQFYDEMIHVFMKARDECNYYATRFLQMVNKQGGLEAAKALLHSEGFTKGLVSLWERGRLDISMEALVLKTPWSGLFTKEELDIARKRLDDLGYNK